MQKKLIYLLTIICFILFSVHLDAQMIGTYLIGPSAPKYKTISQAVDDLILHQGIIGKVTFNIEDGVYNEQIYIPYISNTSPNNPIIFQSLSGDSSKVIITFKPTNDTFNYTIKLDNASYLIFKHLTFSTDTIFGRVIDMNNRCSYNLFMNNRFLGMVGSKELLYSENPSYAGDNNNRLENNLFQYGSLGISFTSVDNTVYEDGNEILKNKFADQSVSAIYLKYNSGFKITGNSISTNTSRDEYTAIIIQNCKDKFYIEKNKLDIKSEKKSSHGISIRFCSGTGSSTASSISNNFIHIYSNSFAYTSGIEIIGSFKNFYFNSIHLTGDNAMAIGFNDIYASDINIFNNIFSNPAGGIPLILNDTLNVNCDYNDFYTHGSILFQDAANLYSTLSAWNLSSGQDLHSVSTDPLFAGNADLHINNFRLYKRGKTISGFNSDIDGNVRKTPRPDIGADEFNYKFDLGSDRYICAGSATTITAEKGFDTYLWSDSSTADTLTVDSAGNIAGIKKIRLNVSYEADHYADSLLVHFVIAQANPGPNRSVCEDENVTIEATGGVKFLWNTGNTTSSINFTASLPGEYAVTVTDQYGCIDTASVWVNVKPRPATPSIILVGTDSLKSSVAGTSYNWFLNKSLLSDHSMIVQAKANGIYQLLVLDSACSSDTSAAIDFHKNNIGDYYAKGQIIIYPNPVSDILFIEVSDFDLSGSSIEIFSVLGKRVYSTNKISARSEIETRSYEKGLYLLRFTNGDKILVRRFVVE